MTSYYCRLYWVHALIKQYLITGRKHALIKKYALNKHVRLLTRLYGIILHGAKVTAMVMDTHHRRSPLVQGGLEIPIQVTVGRKCT